MARRAFAFAINPILKGVSIDCPECEEEYEYGVGSYVQMCPYCRGEFLISYEEGWCQSLRLTPAFTLPPPGTLILVEERTPPGWMGTPPRVHKFVTRMLTGALPSNWTVLSAAEPLPAALSLLDDDLLLPGQDPAAAREESVS